jgi:hypothetical protein
MLKADSRTLKKPREAQSSPMPPMIESEVAWEGAAELLDQVARLALLPGERDQRQREEEERDEGEQCEVRDHGGQVSAPVGQELAQDLTHARGV